MLGSWAILDFPCQRPSSSCQRLVLVSSSWRPPSLATLPKPLKADGIRWPLLQGEGFPWRWSADRAHPHENSSADVQTPALGAPGEERVSYLGGCEAHSPGYHPPPAPRNGLFTDRLRGMLRCFQALHMINKPMSKPPLTQLMGSHMSLNGGVYQHGIDLSVPGMMTCWMQTYHRNFIVVIMGFL